LTVFHDFCLKAQTLPRFKFYRSSVLTLIFRKSANRTVPKHWPFFVNSMLKSLIWWNLLEKREPYSEAFLYEEALKRDICAVQHYLALKNEIFSSTDRAFYKNAQIFTTVRLALTLL
jgi:hypothetical protein